MRVTEPALDVFRESGHLVWRAGRVANGYRQISRIHLHGGVRGRRCPPGLLGNTPGRRSPPSCRGGTRASTRQRARDGTAQIGMSRRLPALKPRRVLQSTRLFGQRGFAPIGGGCCCRRLAVVPTRRRTSVYTPFKEILRFGVSAVCGLVRRLFPPALDGAKNRRIDQRVYIHSNLSCGRFRRQSPGVPTADGKGEPFSPQYFSGSASFELLHAAVFSCTA